MYLQDHFRPDAFLGEAAVDADHCHFDDVGFASLYRCVDSVALGKSPNGVVARGDIRQVAATMEDGLSITLLACQLLGLLHVGVDTGEGPEIVGDEVARLPVGYSHPLSQPEGRDAVDNAKVGLLGFLSLCVLDTLYRFVPYLGGCGSVDILSAPKRFDHVFIATKVGHDAQLYLRVVSREEQTPLFRDKALANFLAVIVSDGDVLQVRVA